MCGQNKRQTRNLFVAVSLALLVSFAQPVIASVCTEPNVEVDGYDAIGIEGYRQPGREGYTMKYVDPTCPPSGWNSAVLLDNPVPEYHFWEGCSPTAAGMMFAYWDAYLGKSNLYTFNDGNSVYWNKSRMDATIENNYGRNGVYPDCGTHSIVASWEHHQAGQAQGLTYGTWDRNGNSIIDDSDRAQWNCLADFMRTKDGATNRSAMASGFEAYAAWDDPETPLSESYEANAWTDYSKNWEEYTTEIDTDYPVHVGIPGWSIFGCGYWTDPDGVYGAPGTQYVVNRTTLTSCNNQYGLIEFSEVYAYTLLRIGDANVVPEPTAIVLLLSLGLGACSCRRRK